jgi:hypothetical protein
MYEDEDPWPIKCPSCGHEFIQKIGWMKTAVSYRCPGPDGCGIIIRHPTEQFILALSEARHGKLNPWGNMLRIREPD